MTKTRGRPKVPDCEKKGRLTITLEQSNYIWCKSFDNRSKVINEALTFFKKNNPNYLASHLLSK